MGSSVLGQAVKELPPKVELGEAARAQLQAAADQMSAEIIGIRSRVRDQPALHDRVADLEIYYNAFRYPLLYHEPVDMKKVKAALEAGIARAKELREGTASWLEQPGARGYVSRIDGSVQPYLLTPPKNFDRKKRYRLDIFLHGRDENLMELKFISAKPPVAMEDRFIVHPYGRYCVANKFAGEVDLLEVIEELQRQYPIDPDRIILTGFSMGGAAVWHIAAHYSDLFAAASPGAGFAETKLYQKFNEKALSQIPWWEQVLWHWYDAPDYAVNFGNLPTISYAGELDPQKQSGDVMERALKAQGLTLERIWGPKTAHAYEKEAKKRLDARLDELAKAGRNRVPNPLKFTTWTLRYNRMHWVTIDAMEQHWAVAKVEARIAGNGIDVQMENVSALTLSFEKGLCPIPAGTKPVVQLNGEAQEGPAVLADGSWGCRFVKINGKWAQTWNEQALHKQHGLQGPIDDAFLDSFLFVRPTGKAMNEKVEAWTRSEMKHAAERWHSLFRGKVRFKDDRDLTAADVEQNHLILWGDPSSNSVIGKVADRLPIHWNAHGVTLGDVTFPPEHHAPVLVYPNPLNPRKYIVLNSGFTFREDSNGTNSRQTPRLPDYAIVDLDTPPGDHLPGKIIDVGFFDEQWKVKASQPKP